METNLGTGNFIFVGSSTDAWAESVLTDWLLKTLRHCRAYKNRYLFQSKNPKRFTQFEFPPNTILGTTIETNRLYGTDISKAPPVGHRVAWLKKLELPKMVSIEPIMDFDLPILADWLWQLKPEFVSIGADSKGHKLPEPSPEKTRILVEQLRCITRVYVKDNLKRLLRQEMPEVAGIINDRSNNQPKLP